MKQNFAGMLLALAVTVILHSCKKAAIEPTSLQAPQNVTESLRSWAKAQDASLSFQKVTIEGKTVRVPQFAILESTQYFPAERMNITPVQVGNTQSARPVYKYLVTELGQDGKISKGNYYVVLNDKKNGSTVTITPGLLKLTEIPGDFHGTIIKYDLENNIIFTKHYEKAALTNKTGNLVTKKAKPAADTTNGGPVGSYAPLNSGCEYVYIDWYYQVYENGVLVYEEYLETTAIVYCEDGGEGGSGEGEGPSGSEIMSMMFANGEVRSTEQAAITINQTVTDVTKRYPWVFYYISNPGFFGLGGFQYTFISEEIGTKHLGNDGKWHWVSFIHGGTHKIGYNAGAVSVDCTDIIPVSQIWQSVIGGQVVDLAKMTLTFNVEMSFIFRGLAFDSSEPKDASHTWTAYTPTAS